MSTQIRNTGGGGRNQKKGNSIVVGGPAGDASHISAKNKTDAMKTEKEKSHTKQPTAEQLRIAQITNSNTIEDPQMREKVATLIEMTQRSEEEVCCALHECDYNLERAVVFLLETLPVGAFETSSKKKKSKATNGTQQQQQQQQQQQPYDGAGGDGEWIDSNANTEKREKSRNRSSNRGGRGGTDSRGWRGREIRENDRNARESRGERDRGGRDRDRDRDRDGDDRNDNYRGGQRNRGGRGGYAGRSGRGGRMGTGGRSFTGRTGGYPSRQNATDDHHEMELWDNTIAQNAEKQNQSQDDAWGDWDNEEYVGSLKEGKVFTASSATNQTIASVVSGGLSGLGSMGSSGSTELGAPPGLEQHLSTSSSQPLLNAIVSGTNNAGISDDASQTVSTSNVTPMMQYSVAVASTQMPQQIQSQPQQQASPVAGTVGLSSTQYNNATDVFTNGPSGAMVQQPQLKSSATLSAEQSQYFNSLTSQNSSNVNNVQQQMSSYAQPAPTAAVQFPPTYANVFASGSTSGGGVNIDAIQLPTGPQPRRARAKLPPPSKIPSTAVEMPSDSLNNIGYLDVQFGALDFGADDSFDTISDKFNNSSLDSPQQQQQQQQTDIPTDYQNKSSIQQQTGLTGSLQNSQMSDSLSNSYTPRTTSGNQTQQNQQIVLGGGNTTSGTNTLDQLTKNDPYNQTNATNTTANYQTSYQVNSGTNKSAAVYQPAQPSQSYNSNYVNPQSTATTYQPQAYGSYQQNSVNSYQQQQQQQAHSAPTTTNSVQTVGNNVTGGSNVVSVGTNSVNSSSNSTQNIPVGGSNTSTNSSNSTYLTSGYPSQQNAYQSTQSVYASSGLTNNTGYIGNTNTSSAQYSNYSTSAKLKDTPTASNSSHFESVSSANAAVSNSSTSVNAATSTGNTTGAGTNANNNNAVVNNTSSNNNSISVSSSNSSTNSGSGPVSSGSGGSSVGANSTGANSNNTSSVTASSVSAVTSSNKNNATSGSGVATAVSATSAVASAGGAAGANNGIVPPNIQMVSQYIQTGLPYYQQPVYSYEDLQMMQQRVPHVGYYDLNYTPTSLGGARDNLGSVAYSTMTDGRFARTDNNSSPVGNVSSTMSQQAGSGGPMLNVPYYFYSGNMMPGGFQYGTPAIYPPQIPTANTASGGQFPKPSYNTGYGSTSYDALSQSSQDYTKGAYQSSVNQATKSQNVSNPQQAGTTSDITSSMYGKGHVALNKVNSYEKQNFHSGTPPPFNMANTQAAGGTSGQPYGMYLPMPATGHHSMIHQPIHQMDGRIHSSSRRDSNSTGQRQQSSSQAKSGTKQGYSPSYWAGQN